MVVKWGQNYYFLASFYIIIIINNVKMTHYSYFFTTLDLWSGFSDLKVQSVALHCLHLENENKS